MKNNLITLLFAATFMMFLAVGCESPNEPLSTQVQSSTLSDATSLAKEKNGKGGYNDRNCNNKNHHNNDHGHNGVCIDDHDGDDNNCTDNNNGNNTSDADGIVTLWAGKTKNAGSVTVTQDQNNLYVQYTASGSWKIRETHLDVSTSAYTQRGAPGQYDYQTVHGNGVTTYTYTVPITWTAGTKISGLTPDTYSIIPGLIPELNNTSAPSAKVIITSADGVQTLDLTIHQFRTA